MLYKKTIYKIISISSIAILLSMPISYADDKTKAISIDPIFIHEDGHWHPGRIESKDFYISNNTEKTIDIDRIYIELKSSKNYITNKSIAINDKEFKEKSKNSQVKLTYDDKVLFEDSLDNLLKNKEIVLSREVQVKQHGKELLNMTIDMDESMVNEAQALENIFSIGVGYKVNSDTGIGGETDSEDDNNNSGDSIGGNNGSTGSGINKPAGGKLPQTGGIINSVSIIAIGVGVVGTGLVLNKKESSDKGGNKHE
ncbi:MAG: LPXTG cell wall anchor domain-containing protein [Terrisporobacter sp.]